MASVRDIFLYSALWLSALALNCDYGYDDCSHGHSRGRKRVVSRRVVQVVQEPQDKRVHVTHEVHHIVHKKRKRVRPVIVDHGYAGNVRPGVVDRGYVGDGYEYDDGYGYDRGYEVVDRPGFRGSVHIVENNQPEVVVVDHGGSAYLQPNRVVINQPALVQPNRVVINQPSLVQPNRVVINQPSLVQPNRVLINQAAVVPVTVQGNPTLVPVQVAVQGNTAYPTVARNPYTSAYPTVTRNPYGTGAIDPRLISVLRGSTPQEGDPLGIYPGGGLDPRIDPSLVPAARGQLEDEINILQDQLDILTRRLGGRGGSGSRGGGSRGGGSRFDDERENL